LASQHESAPEEVPRLREDRARSLQDRRGWRNQPVPAECAKAKAAFLAKLPTLDQPKPETRAKTSRRQKRAKAVKTPIRRSNPYRWFAVAAVLFVGIILTALLLPSKTQASSDIVERLIDWNLEMTSADAKERKRLLDENEANFKKDCNKPSYPTTSASLPRSCLKADESWRMPTTRSTRRRSSRKSPTSSSPASKLAKRRATKRNPSAAACATFVSSSTASSP